MGLLRDLLDADKDGKIVPQILRVLPWAIAGVAAAMILVLGLIGYRVSAGDGFKAFGLELTPNRPAGAQASASASGTELRPIIWQTYATSKRTHIVDCVNDAMAALRSASFEQVYPSSDSSIYGNVRADAKSMIQSAIRCIDLNGAFLMFVSVSGLNESQIEARMTVINAELQKLNPGFDFKRQFGSTLRASLTHYRSKARFPNREACVNRAELALRSEQMPVLNRGGDWISARNEYVSLVFWCFQSEFSQYEPLLYHVGFDRTYTDSVGDRLLGRLN